VSFVRLAIFKFYCCTLLTISRCTFITMALSLVSACVVTKNPYAKALRNNSTNPYTKRITTKDRNQVFNGNNGNSGLSQAPEVGNRLNEVSNKDPYNEDDLYGDITDDMLLTQHFNPVLTKDTFLLKDGGITDEMILMVPEQVLEATPFVLPSSSGDAENLYGDAENLYGDITDDMLCTQDFNPILSCPKPKTVSPKQKPVISNPYKQRKPYKIFRPREVDIPPPRWCKSAYADFCNKRREKAKKSIHGFQLVRTWKEANDLKINFNKGKKYWGFHIRESMRGNIDLVEMLIDMHLSDVFHYGVVTAVGYHISCKGAENEYRNCMELLVRVTSRDTSNKIDQFLMSPAIPKTDILHEDYRRCVVAIVKRMRNFLLEYPLNVTEPEIRTVRTFSKYVEKLKSRMRLAVRAMPGTKMFLDELQTSRYQALHLQDETLSPIMKYFQTKK
jgi:hypothetical protein